MLQKIYNNLVLQKVQQLHSIIQLYPLPHLEAMFLRGNPDESLCRPISLTGSREYRGGRAWSSFHGKKAGDIISTARRQLGHGNDAVRERKRAFIPL